MNIFYLHHCPEQCAKWLCDRHVVKMILETAQLLSTAHVVIDGNQVAYKATHLDHPSTLWVMEAQDNYRWAYRHLQALIEEHQYRYPSSPLHKTARHLEGLSEPPRGIKLTKRTPIKLAMPLILRTLFDGVNAYREYYSIYKRKFKDGRDATWTRRSPPDWF